MDFTLCRKIMDNMARVVVGKNRAVRLLLAAMLAEGHILLEDVPGVGKTLLARSLARSIGGTFRRIQFTPDLLPSDVTGFNFFDQKTGEFKFQPGPVISNILLADEINRTIPPAPSPACLKACRKTRSRWTALPWTCRAPFSSWPPKIRSSWKELFPFPRHSLTAS